MATIEQRAKKSLALHHEESFRVFNQEHRNMRGWEYGYCQGATEQRQIDIEKACEWLIKGGYFINNTESVEDFRKAMEE